MLDRAVEAEAAGVEEARTLLGVIRRQGRVGRVGAAETVEPRREAAESIRAGASLLAQAVAEATLASEAMAAGARNLGATEGTEETRGGADQVAGG